MTNLQGLETTLKQTWRQEIFSGYFAYLNLSKQLYYVESVTGSQSETQEGRFGVISIAVKLGRNSASWLRSYSIYILGNYVPKIS